MIDLLDTARDLQDFCDEKAWPSCIIGGIAAQRWSYARVTRDVDLTLLTGLGGEVEYIETLLGHYQARISDPIAFALQSRV